jgi:membrane associated rhomboid family serine protease
MPDASHTIREEIRGVALFVGAIWAVYFLSLLFPALDHFGIVPRRLVGLVGIPAMPFLHANLQHVLANTVPLVVLLILLAGSRAESWEVVVSITILGGLLLWIFGRTAVHIGASGLISGLTTFLILSGFLELRIVPLVIALFVGFLYGGSLFLGVLPRLGSQVSWDGHLCGAIAGGIVAYALTRGNLSRFSSMSRSVLGMLLAVTALAFDAASRHPGFGLEMRNFSS